MGIGDELMAAGEAGRARRMGGPKVAILDRKGQPRWHPVWNFCADVERPENWTPGGPAIVNCGRLRPYIDWPASLKSRWSFLRYRPAPARVAVPPDLLAAAERWRGRIVIEPNLKTKASPNKDWGWRRWGEMVLQRPDWPWLQLGPEGTKRLPGVEMAVTPGFGEALAVLSVAKAAVLPEGGLHHAAAAVGLPAVVIYGGYISPAQTGYPDHLNLYTGGEPCGWRQPCQHCTRAMEAITPARVLRALDKLLEKQAA
jgi:hypothetical protein